MRYSGGQHRKRRRDAGPVRVLLGGEYAPAAFSVVSHSLISNFPTSSQYGKRLSADLTDVLRGASMTITVEATYENGMLKPAQPLPLKEREQVQVTVHTRSSVADQTYGMIGWAGDADTFNRLLQESETDRLEHA
jgi:predicted DNA-binding antitoxin AbrB/MazE fold protein